MIPILYNWGCNIARREHILPIAPECVRAFVRTSRAESWHSLAIFNRPSRPQVCVPCTWIRDLASPQARIFEPACGSGANLLWLHTQGFENLFGMDISPHAVGLARLLAQHLQAPLHMSIDDALHPKYIPSDIDVLLSVNWLYHIAGVSLEDFFALYMDTIARGGYIIFDIICASYSATRQGPWHTQDLYKAHKYRRQSEYRLRMSCADVEACAARFGCEIVRCQRMYTKPKRWVYAVRKK